MLPTEPPQNTPPEVADPLPKVVETAYKALVFEDLTEPGDYNRTSMLAQATKMNHYWRGDQHLVYESNGQGGISWTPVGQNQRLQYNRSTGENVSRTYDYVMNIYRGDGKKYVGVVGQKSPNVKAVPNRPGDQELIARAKKADALASIFYSAWKADQVQLDIAYIQWNYGTGYGYTRLRADADLYGTTEEPIYGEIEQEISPAAFRCFQCGALTPEEQGLDTGVCQNCGAELEAEGFLPAETAPIPVQTGTRSYANAMVELLITDSFTTTVPAGVKNLKEAPWLMYEYDEDQAELATIYPQLADRVGENFGMGSDRTSETGTVAREEAVRPTTNTRFTVRNKHKWLYTQIWLVPSQYLRIKNREVREFTQRMYPTGVRLVFVQGEFMEAVEEKLTDHWSAFKADVSDSIHSDPVGKDMLPVCDLVNDFMNYNAAAGERIAPLVLGDPTVIDFKQLKRRRGQPGDFIPAKASIGQKLADSFFKFPSADLEPELTQYSNVLLGQVREVTGILPPIFGGDTSRQTATEAEMNRNQALMQLNVPHDQTRAFWEETAYNAAMLFSKGVAGGVTMPGINITPDEAAAFAELAEGGWHYEAAEGMPMTWAQRRALIWSLVDKGPPAWELFNLTDPGNKEKLFEAVGFPDYKIRYLEDQRKAHAIIRDLLEQEPIMSPQGPIPSIAPDEFEDDHAFMRDTVKEWAQSEEGLSAKQNNPAGYANVIAWAKIHHLYTVMADMQQQNAQMRPPLAGGGPEGVSEAPQPGPPQPEEPAALPSGEPPQDAEMPQPIVQ